MDRKTFLRSTLKGAVAGVALSCCPGRICAEETACSKPTAADDAGAVRQWLSDFCAKNEGKIDRRVLIQLLEERGRACCTNLSFRQHLIEGSAGSLEKLVELMGKIVGPENCKLEGKTVTLTYPVDKCVCGWSPVRAADPNDPYCDCSKANNQHLFEVVAGRPVHARVVESQRRTKTRCKFILEVE